MSSSQEAITSPPLPCCAICVKSQTDPARLLPCGHEFHFECIRTVMEDCRLGDTFPLCRAKPEEVRYAFTEDGGGYSTYIPDVIQQLPRGTTAQPVNHRTPSGELATDERGQPPINPNQAERSMLVDRLRLMPIDEPDTWIPPEQAYIIHGQNYIVATRGTELCINQRNVSTATILKRLLKIETIPIFSPLTQFINLTVPPNPADVEKAQLEIEAVLESLGDRRDKFAALTLEDPEMKIRGDSQGLDVSVEKSLKINRERRGALVSKVRLERTTTLTEVQPDVLGGRMTGYEVERVEAFSVEAREKAVRLARIEIQGVLETLMPFAEDPEELEGATTGILETVQAERVECEYCSVGHRNGDCLLPQIKL